MRDIFRTPLGGMLGAPITLLGQGGDAPARPASPVDWDVPDAWAWLAEAATAIEADPSCADVAPEGFLDALWAKPAIEALYPQVVGFEYPSAEITVEEAKDILALDACFAAPSPPVDCLFGEKMNAAGVCEHIVCADGERLNAAGACEEVVCPDGFEITAAGWCIPIQGDEYNYGCVRVSGKYDLIDPFTGEILETDVLEANLPPNTIRLPDGGTLCNPCPADLDPHDENYDSFGCCEPASYERDDRGQCVKTQVCFRPDMEAGNQGAAQYSSEPETVSEVIDTALCEEELEEPGIGDEAGEDTLSTVLVAGGAITALTAIGIALWR